MVWTEGRYEHDCLNCVFLGISNQRGEDPIDMYYCDQHKMPTVIARFGSRPDDYTSGMALANMVPALREAKKIAVARGLITEGGNGR